MGKESKLIKNVKRNSDRDFYEAWGKKKGTGIEGKQSRSFANNCEMAGHYQSKAGMVIVTRVPAPKTLLIVIAPFMMPMISLAKLSPKPVPGTLPLLSAR